MLICFHRTRVHCIVERNVPDQIGEDSMAIDDKPTDLMAARLSKGEDLDLIYTNPKNHIVCFIPTYQPSGGDSTKCYFVDGREEMVHLPMRTITRELAM